MPDSPTKTNIPKDLNGLRKLYFKAAGQPTSSGLEIFQHRLNEAKALDAGSHPSFLNPNFKFT